MWSQRSRGVIIVYSVCLLWLSIGQRSMVQGSLSHVIAFGHRQEKQGQRCEALREKSGLYLSNAPHEDRRTVGRSRSDILVPDPGPNSSHRTQYRSFYITRKDCGHPENRVTELSREPRSICRHSKPPRRVWHLITTWATHLRRG